MKTIFVLAQTALLCLFALTNLAQSDFSGRWEGILEVSGLKLEMNIELAQKDNNWSGTLDIPMQGVKAMPIDELKIDKDSIAFRLKQVPGNAAYKGKRTADKIEGTFQQSGMNLPLAFSKREIAVDPEKMAQYLVMLDSLMKELKVPAAGVGIVKGGKVILATGIGYRDYEKKLPANENTIFAIGSSTKAFTTLGLGMLAQEGKLDWDKPIIEYLPTFRLKDNFATQEMTAIDLVTHQSGLPRHDVVWYATDFSRAELFNRLPHLEPTKSFRTTFQYNNLMYMVAGLLIEKISGKTWEDFTKAQIFQPLGMTRTNTSVDVSQAQDNFALPYQLKKDSIARMPFRHIDPVGPAGSINSSINDMLKWVQLHLDLGKYKGVQLVETEEVKRVMSPHKTIEGQNPLEARSSPANYGLGWFLFQYDDVFVAQHGGNIDGFSALVVLMPKNDAGIVILCNQNASSFPSLAAHYARDMILNKDATDWYKPKTEAAEEITEQQPPKRIENTTPNHPLKAYAGTYEHTGYGQLKVTLKDSQLLAQYYKMQFDLVHWHFETFQGKTSDLEADFSFTFQTDKTGEVIGVNSALALDPTVGDIVFKKIPSSELSDPKFLAKMVGDYELSGVTVKVALKNDNLILTVPRQNPYTLVPKKGTTFDLKNLNGYSVEFTLDEIGLAKEVVFYQPNGTFRAKKVK